ncbi:MAG: SigB/SigF/SigG family RNA polymerase sigma factor [Acidimicrobiia bacterium]
MAERDARGRIDGVPEIELFRKFRATSDRQLRNVLIEAHRPLAIHLARRFSSRTEPLDDLVQVAQLGLLKAVTRFDPDRGVAFSSFATPTILGELKRHFRDATWAVRVSRRAQEMLLEVNAATSELSQRLGRSPSVAEIAQSISVTEAEVLDALEAGAAYRTAPMATPGESDPDEIDLRMPPGEQDVELELADDRNLVRSLLETLPPRERQIVFLRFFEERTQTEIADEIGISQMHVSRLLRQSFRTMQRELAARTSRADKLATVDFATVMELAGLANSA